MRRSRLFLAAFFLTTVPCYEANSNYREATCTGAVILGDRCAVAFDSYDCKGNQFYFAHRQIEEDVSSDFNIRSFIVAAHCELKLCIHDESTNFCTSYANVSRRHWSEHTGDLFNPEVPASCWCNYQEIKCNDTANSAQILGGACAVAFDMDDCSGRKLELKANIIVNELAAHRFNDVIKSFVVTDRCELILCQHKDLSGECMYRSGTERSLAHFGQPENDRTSSALCMCHYDPSKMDAKEKRCTNEEHAKTQLLRENCAIGYSEEDCGGHMLTFMNNTNIDRLANKTMQAKSNWDDKIKSVIVNDWCELKLCPLVDYGHKCDHIRNGSVRSVAPQGFWDNKFVRASSAFCVCPEDLPAWNERPSRCADFKNVVRSKSDSCALKFDEEGCHGHIESVGSESYVHKYMDGQFELPRSVVIREDCELTFCAGSNCSTYTGHEDALLPMETHISTVSCYCYSFFLGGFVAFVFFAFGHVAWHFYKRRYDRNADPGNQELIELH